MKEKPSNRTSNYIYVPFFSFIIPIVITAGAFFLNNIFPTGKNTILTYDLKLELLPYYSHLSELFTGYNNLFYSLAHGLGGNFFGVLAFDLSPIDLIYYFIPQKSLPDAIYFFILLRIGMSGLSCSIYINMYDNIKTRGIWCVVLSCCYALMSYNIAYTSWPVFLSASILLPIIALSVEKILKGDKSPSFVILLSYSIICCYYTSYMIIIAVTIYFIFRSIEEKIIAKQFIQRSFLYMIHGLLSVGISMFILLPVVMDLERGKLSFETAVFQEAAPSNPFSVLAHLLPTSYSNLAANQLPNIYCSSLVLILIIVFLLGSSDTKAKKAALFVILLYLCSFSLPFIDNFWHGFKTPAGYTHRYAFSFVFFLICFAIRGIAHPVKIRFNISNSVRRALLSAVVVYTLFEQLINASFIISKIAEEYEYANHSEYLRMSEDMNNVLSLISSDDTTENYRIIKNFNYTSADNSFYGYKGFELFCSSYNGAVVRFCRNMGMYSIYNYINTTGITPPVASFFNVKYFISLYRDMSDYYNHISDYKIYQVYHNQNALPLGFELSNYKRDTLSDFVNDPFENINDVYSDIVNFDEEQLIFKKIDYQVVSFDKAADESKNILTAKFNAENEGHYWIYIESFYSDSSHFDPTSINSIQHLHYYLNGEDLGEYGENDRRFCSDLGNLHGNQDYTLTIDAGIATGVNLYLYYLDYDCFENIFSKVNGFDVTENSADGIKLNGHMDSPGDVLITLPYEKGYKIVVNGENTDYDHYRDSFILLHLNKGDNEIKIKYISSGLFAGITISILCILIAILYFKKQNAISQLNALYRCVHNAK